MINSQTNSQERQKRMSSSKEIPAEMMASDGIFEPHIRCCMSLSKLAHLLMRRFLISTQKGLGVYSQSFTIDLARTQPNKGNANMSITISSL